MRDPKARRRDVGLVAILLKEQPLKHFGALKGVDRQIGCCLGQMEKDGVGLGQRPPILEDQNGNPAIRIDRQKVGRPRLAPIDVHLDPLEGLAQQGQQEPDLIGIARRQIVVKPQHKGYSAAIAGVSADLAEIYCIIASAASRPSRMAQTTKDAPRTMSPAANTPSSDVMKVF